MDGKRREMANKSEQPLQSEIYFNCIELGRVTMPLLFCALVVCFEWFEAFERALGA